MIKSREIIKTTFLTTILGLNHSHTKPTLQIGYN